MANIITYPPITTVAGEDLMIVSDTSLEGNPTRTVSVDALGTYVASQVSAGAILSVKVSLTAAQLKSLDTTEIEAIPNPGVGKFIKINSAIWSFVWGTTPFDAVTVKLNQECDNGYATCPFTLSRTSDRLREGDYDTNINSCPNSNVTVGGSANSVLTGDSTLDVYISYQIITL